MGNLAGLDNYLEHLCAALGQADRRVSLKDYCRGLMLPSFLITQRLNHRGSKKTLLGQKSLPYPTITSLAAAGRTQRHVPDSIPTLRALIARAIAIQLQRCPCCYVVRYNL